MQYGEWMSDILSDVTNIMGINCRPKGASLF
jgi:hypothetical protein